MEDFVDTNYEFDAPMFVDFKNDNGNDDVDRWFGKLIKVYPVHVTAFCLVSLLATALITSKAYRYVSDLKDEDDGGIKIEDGETEGMVVEEDAMQSKTDAPESTPIDDPGRNNMLQNGDFVRDFHNGDTTGSSSEEKSDQAKMKPAPANNETKR